MRTGEAAQALGLDTKTITNYISHELLQPFFSESARGRGDGLERDISSSDLVVLNTIAKLRKNMARNKTDWPAIAGKLASGYRDSNLPAGAALVMRPESERALATVQERNRALERVTELELALANYLATIEQLREEIAELHRERADDRERLLREMGQKESELRSKIARLETQLDLWERGRLRPE
jgi:uncharacterized coiled-coil protein SlyX